jgi:Thioesterase superfamily.
MRIDYLAPGTGEVMLAEADCTRVGESVATVDVVIMDADGERLATARGTYKTGGDSSDSAWSEGTPSIRDE